MQLTAFPDREALFAAATERLANALTAGIAERGAACAALSGGASPEPIYRALARLPLDWPKITFAMIDERFVPLTHEASNQAMIERTLSPALAAGARLAPIYSAAADVDAAADRADAAYAQLTFDIALMGMGEDGHTASWFPNARGVERALDPQSGRAIVGVHAPQAFGTPERLTLTRAALARAKRLVLVITGDAKRAVFERAAEYKLPVAALFAPDMPLGEALWAP